jgi:hypothetical protein
MKEETTKCRGAEGQRPCGDSQASRVAIGARPTDGDIAAFLKSYFGARNATICSKQGSPLRGSHHGISLI